MGAGGVWEVEWMNDCIGWMNERMNELMNVLIGYCTIKSLTNPCLMRLNVNDPIKQAVWDVFLRNGRFDWMKYSPG